MDGVAQPAAAQISVMDTPLDHCPWRGDASNRMGSYSNGALQAQRRVCQHDSIHYPLRESLLRDRMPFGAVTEANKELFRMPKRGGTLKVDSQSSDRAYQS